VSGLTRGLETHTGPSAAWPRQVIAGEFRAALA